MTRERAVEMFAQVEFQHGWSAEHFRKSDELGFFVLNHGPNQVRVVGFHADVEDRDAIVPELTHMQRQEEFQGLNHNAKGMGLMLGNSPEAIDDSFSDQSRTVGLWITPPYNADLINGGDIVKLNDTKPGSPRVLLKGLYRHAQYIRHERKWGPAHTIDLIEEPYGDADLAIINPAPTWLIKQRLRKIKYPVIPPLWALYRDEDHHPLIRIGKYQRK